MARIYATWNPDDKYSGITLSGGNLVATHDASAGQYESVRSTVGVSSGKWYWEYVFTIAVRMAGVAKLTSPLNAYIGSDAAGYGYFQDGNKYNNGSGTAYGSAFTTNVIGVALDMDSGTLAFYRDNVAQGTAFTGLSGTFYAAISMDAALSSMTANFGATALVYSPPGGFNTGLYTDGIMIDSSLNQAAGSSFSFTNAAGNFLVAVACTNSSTPLSATYNGVSMTLAQNQQFSAQSNWLQVFTLMSPATGSNTLAFTGANKVFNTSVVSYNNVKTSGQPEVSNATSANATSVSNSITPLTANSWVIAAFGANSAPTSYSNVLARVGNAFPYVGDSNSQVPASSYTQSATSSSTPWAMIQLAIAPQPGAVAANSGFFLAASR